MIVLCSTHKGEIQMKNLLIIVVCTINNKKIKCVKDIHNSIVWFCNLRTLYIIVFFCNFWTPHIIVNFCTFGHSDCGRMRSEFSKLKEKERNNNDTNKKLKWKNLVSWKKKSNLKRNNKEINKIRLGRNYLKRINTEIVENINIKGEKDL